MTKPTLRTLDGLPRVLRRATLGRVVTSLLLEVGLVLAVAGALLAMTWYFTRQVPQRAWGRPLSYWIAMLDSASPAYRDSAMAALEFLEPSTPAMAGILAARLSDPNASLRVRAAALLITLAESSQERAVDVERAMVSILRRHGANAERIQAALVLSHIWREPATMAALVHAARDTHAEVRSASIFALGSGAARHSRDAMNAVLTGMRDSSAEVRAAAMESLRQSWPDDDAVLAAAAIAVKDTARIVREEAIHALNAFKRIPVSPR
ncbi:MAG: HEAT repeat domain-containing protein [Gemmatimonadota bacterium]